jgi:hypothetical protein
MGKLKLIGEDPYGSKAALSVNAAHWSGSGMPRKRTQSQSIYICRAKGDFTTCPNGRIQPFRAISWHTADSIGVDCVPASFAAFIATTPAKC